MVAPAQGHGREAPGFVANVPQFPRIWGLRQGRCLGPEYHPHFTDKGTFLTPQGLEPDRLVVSWLGCSTPWSLGQERGSLLV